MKTNKLNSYLDVVRRIYLCLLTVYTILREVIPLQDFIGNELFAYSFFGIGLLIIGVSFLLNKDYLLKSHIGLLIAFIGVCVITTLVNFRFDLISNVKAIGWMSIFFFMLYPSGYHGKVTKGKDIVTVFTTSIVTLSLLNFISLPMYFFDIDYTYLNENIIGLYSSQGFSNEFMRLWGVFGDANTGAVYSFVALLMSIYLFARFKNKLFRAYLVLSDIMIFIFIVLSGSRTAQLALFVAIAWIAFYTVFTKIDSKTIKKFAISSVACILAVAISYGAFAGVRFGLPYLKGAVNEVCSKSVNKSIHLLYDDAYKMGNIDIIVGLYQEDDGKENDKKPGKIESIDRTDVDEKGDISNGRFAKWEDAIEMFFASPVIGASPRGVSSFGKVHCPDNDISRYGFAAHNFLLEIMMGTGVLGLLVALLILLNAAVIILKTTFKKKFDNSYLVYSTVILSLICSSMMLSDLFFNLTFGGLAFWMMIGAVVGEDKNFVVPENLTKTNDGKKRILVYGPKDPVGGVEKIVYEYVKHITNNHSDVSFDFIEYGENFSLEPQLNELGCRVIYLPSRKTDMAEYKKAIETVFAQTDYVAVWGNYSGLTNIDLLTLAKKYNVPVRIAHSHGSRLYWGNAIMKYVVHILHYYNKLKLTNYATDFWACSDIAGKFMFPKSVWKKIEIINNAVDTKVFYPDDSIREKIRTEFNIGKDTLVVGHVARMCEIKNQSFLLEIIAQMKNINNDCKLLFVGDGELRQQVENKIKELGIENDVILTGERNDVADLLRAMDVFVLTSFSEGLSVSAVEAQASGLPCVLPTAVSMQTDITGSVKFVSLDKSAQIWAKEITNQAQKEISNPAEKIKANNFEIDTQSELICKKFVG